MNNRIITLIIACLTTAVLYGQSITEDPAITRMMDSFVAYNKEHQEVRGWRVQILVTTDRRQMERVRSRFELTYPEYELHFSHENPFYHLKTGAFMSQQDARPFLFKLRKQYPNAFIVADEIEVGEILKYQ